MVPKCKMLKNIPLHGKGLNYETKVCELVDHVKEKGLSLNWPTKLRPTKKTPPSSFPNHLLESV
jgi:hypothetical protein